MGIKTENIKKGLDFPIPLDAVIQYQRVHRK